MNKQPALLLEIRACYGAKGKRKKDMSRVTLTPISKAESQHEQAPYVSITVMPMGFTRKRGIDEIMGLVRKALDAYEKSPGTGKYSGEVNAYYAWFRAD